MKKGEDLKIYFGHHKCASEFIIQMLLKVAGYVGMRSYYLRNDFDAAYYEQVCNKINKRNKQLIISQSSSMRKVKYFKNFKGFHVIRDPRDICVSAYYSHLYTHKIVGWPELQHLREQLKKVSMKEGLFIEMEFLKPFIADIGEWNYNQSNILEMKMEELVARPQANFRKIFEFLEILTDTSPNFVQRLTWDALWVINVVNRRYPHIFPIKFSRAKIDKDKVAKFVENLSFKRLSNGRKPGRVNIHSHYRKGTPQDWKNHFSAEHKRHFKHMYGDLLMHLGYEKNMDW